MVLVLACAMVVTDFVRHPFSGTPPGTAAVAQRPLTLWTPGTDSGMSGGRLIRAAARLLDAPNAPVNVRAVDGGVSAAVLALLDDELGPEDDLLVIDGGTFADLERERHDVDLPDVARQAARAERLLLAARPLTVLARDTLAVAATRRSGIVSAPELIARMRADSDAIVLGVGGEPWAVNALAAFVDGIDVHGQVRYRVLPTDNPAGLLDRGDIDAVVAPASELRRYGVGTLVRPLATSVSRPAASGSATTALPRLGDLLGPEAEAASLDHWVAVVAPRALRGERRARLTRRLRRLVGSGRWHRALERRGFIVPSGAFATPDLLRRSLAETRRLVAVAGRIARRTDHRID